MFRAPIWTIEKSSKIGKHLNSMALEIWNRSKFYHDSTLKIIKIWNIIKFRKQ